VAVAVTTVVTGGAGFLGRRVVARLRERGEDVVSLDVVAPTGAGELRVDVTSFDEVAGAFAAVRPDRVVHLAYLLLPEAPPHFAYRLNIGGTDNVLEAARQFDAARVVVASSLGVHGPQHRYGDRPVTEADISFADNNQYGRHKIFNESQARDYAEQYGMSVTAVRPGHVTGPDKVLGSMDHVRCITEPAQGRPVRFPYGDEMRCAIHVDEVADVFATVVLADRPRHDVYDTGGATVSLRELADLVRTYVPDASIGFDAAEGARAAAGTYRIDNSRLRDEFGLAYRPYEQQVGSIVAAVRG
jgi:nucleoside-diphosphate-sugar epimerase